MILHLQLAVAIPKAAYQNRYKSYFFVFLPLSRQMTRRFLPKRYLSQSFHSRKNTTWHGEFLHQIPVAASLLLPNHFKIETKNLLGQQKQNNQFLIRSSKKLNCKNVVSVILWKVSFMLLQFKNMGQSRPLFHLFSYYSHFNNKHSFNFNNIN